MIMMGGEMIVMVRCGGGSPRDSDLKETGKHAETM
jgi:hypothetical protein